MGLLFNKTLAARRMAEAAGASITSGGTTQKRKSPE
jgi:hypothetical protein